MINSDSPFDELLLLQGLEEVLNNAFLRMPQQALLKYQGHPLQENSLLPSSTFQSVQVLLNSLVHFLWGLFSYSKCNILQKENNVSGELRFKHIFADYF